MLAEEREHARRWKNGNQRALEEHPGKDSGPNELKLSDGGEKGKNQRRTLPRRSLERLVRRVELGVWGTGTRVRPAGGMTGDPGWKG